MEVIGAEERMVEYDDQAWVAAANSIVAELARTNGLLQQSIGAAEGSRAAIERMSTNMEAFLQQQREFQAILLEGIRNGIRVTDTEAVQTEDSDREASGSGSGSGGDMEMEE